METLGHLNLKMKYLLTIFNNKNINHKLECSILIFMPLLLILEAQLMSFLIFVLL